jgi:hypothetical protein
MAKLEVETTTSVRSDGDGFYTVYLGVLVSEADGTPVQGLKKGEFNVAVVDGPTHVQVKEFGESSTETGWPADGLYRLLLWPQQGEWPPGEQYACVLAVTRSYLGGEGLQAIWDRGQALFTFTLTSTLI